MIDTAQGFLQTTLLAAMATANATYEALAMQVNNSLADKYHDDFTDWLKRIQANLTNEPAPAPPMGVDVAQGSDPTNPAAKWPYLAPSTVPVCEPLPLPPDAVLHLSSVAKVGNKVPFTANCWQALDTLPQTDIAVQAVSADGVIGWFRKVVQFGNLGHYERVA